MKQFVYLTLFGLIAQSFSAQQKIKYETVFFDDNAVETTHAKLAITDGVAEKEFIKVKLKVTNYTDKALVIKPEECSFTTQQGEIFSKDKWMVIAPRQQESKVIDVKGEDLKTTETTFKINGFYLCAASETIATSEMPLPPQKELSIGNFKLELDGWDRDGKEIMIKYIVKYTGDKIGLFNPGKVLLKSPEGGVYKNQKEKDKTFSFKKKEDFLIGFLYLSDSKKDNIIQWNDAFSEASPQKLEAISIPIKMDLAKTKDKN